MSDIATSPDTSSTPAALNGESPATGINATSPVSGLGTWKKIFWRSDIGLALGVIGILVVLILPMPAVVLDFLLALSITFSVLVLMTALFIETPLEFSAFPTVLLITTMLRLALNLASTRLILSNGHEGTSAAGNVIEAFGNFITQGNFIIGIIVFAILVIVNFVVITKGSGRIAEVAARFTLDAMPGKQMAIDADLSAGLIGEDEARTRRKKLEDESSFFGAMDGASKFVRGDAIAGILITFINIIAGIIIGVGQKDMTFSDAAEAYTLLTIGDGLVSQIPALIVSIAAGLLVSKAGVEGAADKALVSQLSGYPKALGMSAFLMLVMAALPGIPIMPFLMLAGIAGGMAWKSSSRIDEQEEEKVVAQVEAQAEPAPVEEPITSALHMDDLRLELGYGLLPLINSQEGDRLTEQIKALRRQMATDMGFIMPSVRILDNMQLESNAYSIKVKEVESGTGELFINHFLAMDPKGGAVDLPGQQTTEPAFGLAATWIDDAMRDEASFRGYTVVDPSTVLTTHLTEILKTNMAELLSYAEVQKLLNELSDEHQKLIEDIVPSQISVSGIQRVLQALLLERVSIRDLATIMEGIAEATSFTQHSTAITEHVRSRLARQLCAANTPEAGYLAMISLSPEWEQKFADSLVGQGEEKQLAMAPSELQAFISLVRDRFEEAAVLGELPVLLCSPAIRPYVRMVVERFRNQTTVMSQSEVHPTAKLKTVGAV